MAAPKNQYNTSIQEGTFNNSLVKGEIDQHVPVKDGLVTFNKTIAAGAAGADIDGATEVFYSVPTGYELKITSARIIALGTSAGIDADNTCVITVEDTETTAHVFATKTFSDDPAFPAAKASAELTVQDGIKLAAGKSLTYTVTQGTTADHNGFELIVEGTLSPAY